ncbi:hypothetical protein NCS55_00744400 [Fusarium keratoplasticum]|nr:hypothetical protein NCS55_00744400 [Fusarium keratoplasticum]
MAEALGIASGVAGIVSLGITICRGLDTFFSAIKDRNDDLKRATELLTLLRRYIELIRPSASTLSSRHAQATDLVVLALGSCEGELRALKELVDNLNKVDGASDVARKWDKSKSIITYPFQRKKLIQIQDQLLKATGALGTVIQALILHVGVGVGDDIEAFRSAVRDNHLVTTASLTRLESKVERIEGSARQTEARLTAISTRVEEQKTLASSSQTLIKDTSLMVSGKLDAIAEGSWLGPQAQTVGTAHQKDIPRSTKTTITYTGLRFLLSKVLSFSLQRDYQCGGSLTTHSLRTYNVRETSPAFEVFGLFNPLENYYRGFDLTTLVQEAIKKLQIAYTSGKASPLDVDEFGRNAAHWCIQSYDYCIRANRAATKAEGSEGLKIMLLFLQQVGVNVYAVYDVLANCEWQFDPEQDPERAGDLNFPLKLGWDTETFSWPWQNEMKQGSKELIENIKFVEYVRETDIFGQNIVHFCLNWDTGLRLLLDKEATHHLVNQPDTAGFTPLMDALKLSDLVCEESHLCPGCSCPATVKLLLETDCPMGLDLIAHPSGFRASPKAKTALLEHLAPKRKRLLKLALHHLPESELRDLGVSLNELSDMTVLVIWDRLQSLHQSGVVQVLHNGLDPLTKNELSNHVQRGIFHLLDDPRDAEVVFNLGFKGIDTPDGDGCAAAQSGLETNPTGADALRIRHLPACHRSVYATEDTVQRTKEVEEWDDMLDEDRALIERLGELTEEFEQEFSNQNVSIADFLWLHWLPRIRQVRRERKALDDSNRQELRELGVVLDEEIGQEVYYDSAEDTNI